MIVLLTLKKSKLMIILSILNKLRLMVISLSLSKSRLVIILLTLNWGSHLAYNNSNNNNNNNMYRQFCYTLWHFCDLSLAFLVTMGILLPELALLRLEKTIFSFIHTFLHLNLFSVENQSVALFTNKNTNQSRHYFKLY